MISNKISDGINGFPNIPGDKSISHRAIIIPSISNGTSIITNILKSDDVMHTLNAFKSMGVKIIENEKNLEIHGKGLNSLSKPKGDIYLGNSGTSARLLSGLLASQKFDSTLIGDASLSKRPMRRISDPLKKMSAKIQTSDGCLPINIKSSKLKSAKINITVPSAQVKSGLLLACLNTEGQSKIIENSITRNHTEIMLKSFGAKIDILNDINRRIITIEGKNELISRNIDVPSDLSSSAFFIVAALINKNSKILLKNINVNPTRNGLLIALKKMGAKISFINKRLNNEEEICDIKVESSELEGCELSPDIADLMIDEYPILSVAASFAKTPSIFRGLKELRLKESDRLKLIVTNLSNFGINCEIREDDLYINPKKKLDIINNLVKTDFDHRIAMSFCVMATKIGPLRIDEPECINTSFPTFKNEINKIGANIS